MDKYNSVRIKVVKVSFIYNYTFNDNEDTDGSCFFLLVESGDDGKWRKKRMFRRQGEKQEMNCVTKNRVFITKKQPHGWKRRLILTQTIRTKSTKGATVIVGGRMVGWWGRSGRTRKSQVYRDRPLSSLTVTLKKMNEPFSILCAAFCTCRGGLDVSQEVSVWREVSPSFLHVLAEKKLRKFCWVMFEDTLCCSAGCVRSVWRGEQSRWSSLMTCSSDFPSVTLVLAYRTGIALAKIFLFFIGLHQCMTGDSDKAHSPEVGGKKSRNDRLSWKIPRVWS